MLVLILAAFLAGLVESAAGFGSALLAMPILIAVVDVRVAAPLFSILAIVLNGSLLHRHRASFHAGEASRLVLGSLLGIPLGLFALKHVPEALVENVLGSVLVLHAGYSLLSARRASLLSGGVGVVLDDTRAMTAIRLPISPRRDAPDSEADPGLAGRLAGLFAGFAAGALGGAYNTPGPPVVLYGSLRGWAPGRFKSNLQGFFLATGVLVAGGHVAGGLVTDRVVRLAAILAAPMLCGAALGSMLDRKISSESFGRILFALTGTMGVWILVR